MDFKSLGEFIISTGMDPIHVVLTFIIVWLLKINQRKDDQVFKSIETLSSLRHLISDLLRRVKDSDK